MEPSWFWKCRAANGLQFTAKNWQRNGSELRQGVLVCAPYGLENVEVTAHGSRRLLDCGHAFTRSGSGGGSVGHRHGCYQPALPTFSGKTCLWGHTISRNGPQNVPLARVAFTCGLPGASNSTSSGRRNGRMAMSSTAFVKKLKSVCRTAFNRSLSKLGH